MNCPNCGKKLKENQKFCTQCGKKLEIFENKNNTDIEKTEANYNFCQCCTTYHRCSIFAKQIQ